MSSHLSGVKNPNARFDAVEVRRIRQLWKKGRRTAVQLANRFGVSEQTIISLVHGHTYKHVLMRKTDTKNRLTKKGEKHPAHKLSNKQVREIRTLLSAGELSPSEIGLKFGVSRHTITDIRDSRSWTHVV